MGRRKRARPAEEAPSQEGHSAPDAAAAPAPAAASTPPLATGLRPVKRARVMKTVRAPDAESPAPAAPAEGAPAGRAVPDLDADTIRRAVTVALPAGVEHVKRKLMKKVCSAAGEVEAVHKQGAADDAAPQQFLVVFAQQSGAQKAARSLHGLPLAQLGAAEWAALPTGRTLRVEAPLPPEQRVHVSPIPADAAEGEIRRCLEKYGEVKFVHRPSHAQWCFAGFADAKSARRATSAEVTILRKQHLTITPALERAPMQERELERARDYLKALSALNPFVVPAPSGGAPGREQRIKERKARARKARKQRKQAAAAAAAAAAAPQKKHGAGQAPERGPRQQGAQPAAPGGRPSGAPAAAAVQKAPRRGKVVLVAEGPAAAAAPPAGGGGARRWAPKGARPR